MSFTRVNTVYQLLTVTDSGGFIKFVCRILQFIKVLEQSMIYIIFTRTDRVEKIFGKKIKHFTVCPPLRFYTFDFLTHTHLCIEKYGKSAIIQNIFFAFQIRQEK